ncbi:MAG: mechanosensitive ion channel [Thermoplasmata archaeon]
MKKKVLASVLMILFVVSFLFIPSAESQDPMIGEDDEYFKEVKIETEAAFRWTVYRNSSVDYVFRVTTQGELADWITDISPDYFVLDEKNPYEIVTVTLEVPLHPDRGEKAGEIIFTYRELNGTVHRSMSRDMTLRVKGVAPVPENNTLVGGFPNPLPEPLDNPYGAFLLNMVIWVAIGWISYSLISLLIHASTKNTKTDVDEIIIRMLRKPILGLIILYGFVESLMKLELTMGIRTTVYQIYVLFVVIMGGVVLYRIILATLNQIAKERGGMRTSFGRVLKPVLEKSFAVIVILAGLMMVFRVLGFELTGLLAGAGVVGLVIAFAAQDTLSNFFSGMHILLDRPFVIGDIILLESGEYCRVEEIGMRSTKLYNIREHEGIILPNNTLANQMIVNVAKPDITIKTRMKVGVAYGSDVKKVKKLLREVAEEHPNVLDDEEHPISVRFRNFADSSLDFNLVIWIDDIVNQWAIMSDIRERIDERFREENINIPFPQRTLWLHETSKK